MTILDILGKKVIPWAGEQGRHRLVVADESLDGETVPEGMRLSHKKLRGRRVAARWSREYGRSSNNVAKWPEDGLEEEMLPFVLCVVSGTVDLQVGEKVLHCSEGHFVLIPPRVPFSSGDRAKAVRTGNIPDLMSFQNWDDRLQCILGYSIGTSLYFPNASVIQLLDLLIEEALSRRPDNQVIIANMFGLFLSLLQRDLVDGHCFGQSLVPVDAPNSSTKVDPIERVQRFVKSNLGQPLTTDAAATMALMSRSQFIRQFRRVTGQSYIEYVTDCRVEEVKMLLRETDWTIHAIHHYVGYKDVTRLREVFVGRVGMGMIEYRKWVRSAQNSF